MTRRDLYGPLSAVVPRIVMDRYKRPLMVGMAGSVSIEALLLIVYGFILYPEGSFFIKALWTTGFVLGWLLFSPRGQALLNPLFAFHNDDD